MSARPTTSSSPTATSSMSILGEPARGRVPRRRRSAFSVARVPLSSSKTGQSWWRSPPSRSAWSRAISRSTMAVQSMPIPSPLEPDLRHRFRHLADGKLAHRAREAHEPRVTLPGGPVNAQDLLARRSRGAGHRTGSWSASTAASCAMVSRKLKRYAARSLAHCQPDLSHPFYWAPFTLLGNWR